YRMAGISDAEAKEVEKGASCIGTARPIAPPPVPPPASQPAHGDQDGLQASDITLRADLAGVLCTSRGELRLQQLKDAFPQGFNPFLAPLLARLLLGGR